MQYVILARCRRKRIIYNPIRKEWIFRDVPNPTELHTFNEAIALFPEANASLKALYGLGVDLEIRAYHNPQA